MQLSCSLVSFISHHTIKLVSQVNFKLWRYYNFFSFRVKYYDYEHVKYGNLHMLKTKFTQIHGVIHGAVFISVLYIHVNIKIKNCVNF